MNEDEWMELQWTHWYRFVRAIGLEALKKDIPGFINHGHCKIKQKGGIGYGHTPKIRLSLALFTLNFLQLDKEGRSAAERHANTSPSKLGYAKWKDVLTGSWNGPDPVLAWARGSVCMFP